MRLGPYEILAAAGSGGMGDVYRARDTRLDRIVAVKVMPEIFLRDPARRQRLEREARAVSSLSHPNICTLHDVGHQDGVDYLVMEFLEGETLADRLDRGALPPDQALRYAVEIAGALDAAHRRGVVHRDLKPGNIMLTRTGAKLLDFGLARADPEAAPEISGLSITPTRTRPLTAEGTVVGTVQYMAPEQLEGKPADARSDLFAFGAVIYEMATGQRAFQGKSQASLIAAILKEEPRPISTFAPMSPPSLDRLVRHCLEKDPEERIQSAHDVRLRLEEIAEGGGSFAVAPIALASARSRWRERFAWMFAALASLAAIAMAARLFLNPAVAPPLVVSSVPPPEGFTFESSIEDMAISPDGRRIVFAARGAGGVGLWVRDLDTAKPRALAGTEDASCPFWSPDARSIGFIAKGHLRKVDVSGGQSDVLASANICLGASWEKDGSILFVPDRYIPVMKIPESGGQPIAVGATGPAGSKRIYSHPSLLPDRRHILYTVNESWEGGENSGIYVATVDGKDERRVLPVLSNARYVEPGYLIYARDGSLRAQRFDPGRLELSGDQIVLIDGIQYVGIRQSHVFSLSDNGVLVYVAGEGTLTRRLTWVDRKGAVLGTIGRPGNYFSPRLSRDGRRVAYDQSEATTDSGDIWTLDRERGMATRLTFDPRNESAPVWSPDDRRLLFYGNYPGRSDLFTVPSDGTGKVETILSDDADNVPCDWSSDGKSILVQRSHGSGGNTDLWLFSLGEKKAAPWLDTPFVEKQGRFSPNLRWIAYDSDESGKTEVYIRGFNPPGGKWRVSSDGGDSPVWRADSREIFYRSPDANLMSVGVLQGTTFDGAVPVPLFKIPGKILELGVATQYDVSADGQRFLMNIDTPTQGQRTITLVSNWLSLLKKH